MAPDESPTGIATPNAPIEPAPGQAGQVAVHERLQDLRQQVRDGTLRFASQAPKEPVAAPTPTPPPAGDEGEVEEEADEAATADEGAPAADEPAPDAGEGTAESIKVALPARNAGDAPFEIETEDPDVAERLRQLNNAAMRGEEFKRRMETVTRREDQLAYIDHQLQNDPITFLASRIPQAEQQQLAEFILAQPGMLERVAEKLGAWEQNPDARRADYNELRATSASRQRDIQDRFESDRESKRAVRIIEDAVDTLASRLDGRRSQMFVSDAMADLSAFYHRENRDTALSPEELVAVLTPRIEMYGLTVEQARQMLSGQPPAPVPAAKPDAAAAARLSEQAKAGARKLVRAANGRRAAAAVGGVGTPAPVGPAAPPAGQGVKERISWLKQQWGFASKTK